jgi:class 3 adenylate cyclase
VAVHWGASLYIGQVATEGRLEVTALGDEVNEAARIEQSAKGGCVLASKQLLERLSAGDVATLDLDPTRIAYEPVTELEGAPDKAARDAGSIAVADVKTAHA